MYYRAFVIINLLESGEKNVNKYKTGKSIPHLEITELVLVRCNVVVNDYLQDLRILCTFAPNRSFG